MSFCAKIVTERPGHGGEIFFHYPGKRSADGLLVSVQANAASWFGIFAGGETEFVSLFANEGEKYIVAFSKGAGYVVDITKPESYWTLHTSFVAGAYCSDEGSVVLCWTPWELISIAKERERWVYAPGSDGFSDIRIAGRRVHGKAYIPENATFRSFCLDVVTGAPLA